MNTLRFKSEVKHCIIEVYQSDLYINDSTAFLKFFCLSIVTTIGG